jgi:hypothetical protein
MLRPGRLLDLPAAASGAVRIGTKAAVRRPCRGRRPRRRHDIIVIVILTNIAIIIVTAVTIIIVITSYY